MMFEKFSKSDFEWDAEQPSSEAIRHRVYLVFTPIVLSEDGITPQDLHAEIWSNIRGGADTFPATAIDAGLTKLQEINYIEYFEGKYYLIPFGCQCEHCEETK